MNTVVYYPHISPSPDWLKLAALCWNTVYRLVPASPWSYASDNDVSLDRLDKALGGVLQDISAQSLASREVNDKFIQWVKTHKGKLERERQYQDYTDKISFYLGKADMDVIRFLEQEGYRVEGPFMFLPKYIAHYYLSLCASEKAKSEKCDAVTDEQNFTDIFFYSSPLYEKVATAVVQAYLPENLITLEPERIREFRVGKEKEVLKYQEEIQSLVDKYSRVSSVSQLESVKRDIIEIAKDEVEKVKRNFQRSNQRLVLKAFGISLTAPALIASIASMLHIGIIEPVGIATALSVFAPSALIDWKEAESAKSDSSWSYILKVSQM